MTKTSVSLSTVLPGGVDWDKLHAEFTAAWPDSFRGFTCAGDGLSAHWESEPPDAADVANAFAAHPVPEPPP